MDYFVDGHRGAGMVAAHFLCVDNTLEARARARIAEQFSMARIVEQHEALQKVRSLEELLNDLEMRTSMMMLLKLGPLLVP